MEKPGHHSGNSVGTGFSHWEEGCSSFPFIHVFMWAQGGSDAAEKLVPLKASSGLLYLFYLLLSWPPPPASPLPPLSLQSPPLTPFSSLLGRWEPEAPGMHPSSRSPVSPGLGSQPPSNIRALSFLFYEAVRF